MNLLSILATFALAFSTKAAADGVSTNSGKPWGYQPNNSSIYGPSEWGLKEPTCNGKRQSPIDISVKDACGKAEETPFKFSGECTKFYIKATEESYKYDVKNGTCKLSVNGKSYSLLQLHSHAPSEHTINGKAFDAETHFVHKEDGGDGLLVIGVFLEKTAQEQTAPYISSLWNALKQSVSSPKATAVNVPGSYADLVTSSASKGHVFNYPGSLTTPGCAEIVDWWVIQRPAAISNADLTTFQDLLKTRPATFQGQNARPVQPLNGRTVHAF